MTQTVIQTLTAFALIAASFGIPMAAIGFVFWLRQGPQYTVESPAMPELTERYWTRKQAMAAARELTDEMNYQFSVVELA
jgi:hypothetical protein